MVMAAMLATLLTVAKYALDALPNIELVSLLVILYTLCFPKLVLPAVYTYIFIYGLLNGFGIWWFPQLYIWAILIGITWLCRRNTSVTIWAVICGAFGLCYGALYAISYGVMNGGIVAGFAWWVSGIPFDITHCIGNFAITMVLFIPLKKWLLYSHRLVDKSA